MKPDLPITVQRKVGIRADGEITRLTISQRGCGEMQLTEEQARVLVQQIGLLLPSSAPTDGGAP